jgi:hypothetical protein
MICAACGGEMRLVREVTEGAKTYLWYACEEISCGRELLHIKTDGTSPEKPAIETKPPVQ